MLQKAICILLVPLVFNAPALNAQSPPGEPSVTHCRSYEKETFSCWWQPGSDGGLPTNYSLMYWTEKNESPVECPDYHTSGPNSCYFSKAHVSIWRYYIVIVNASNALGWNASKLFGFEAFAIVQPSPPRNLSFSYEGLDSSLPYLIIKWSPPEKVDIRTGWITLKYQVRFREEKKQFWEEHLVEEQTKLKLFSLTPGKNYVVQVRCKADTGKWSEWSEEGYVQIPRVTKKPDLTLWISIAVLSVIICLTLIWTLALRGCSWMSCICPPVPGPKIMGFDTQLLKSGKSEDLLGALGCQGFPPTSDCEDLLVEFLEVDDSKEQLMSSPEREPQCQHMKVNPVDTDNDSGRGSCDSPFALLEGTKDQRVSSQGFESIQNIHDHLAAKSPWSLQDKSLDSTFSNFSDDKSLIWSDGKTSSNQSPKSSYHNVTDVCKLALGVMNARVSEFSMPTEDKTQPMYFRTIENSDDKKSNKENDFGDLHSKGVEADMLNLLLNEKMPFMAPRSMDYVEVHKVNQNSALALVPKHKENKVRTDQYSILVPNQEYSKVETVEANNTLVLMQNLEPQISPPSGGDVMKEFVQKPQTTQPEKLMSILKPVVNEGEMKSLGMGYMDPSSFLP